MQITIREPGSAITHFIGMLLAGAAAMPLLAKAGLSGSETAVWAMMVFIGSMVLLYGASTLYHAVTVPKRILSIFKKLDHMMIFVLIAGSYTPVWRNSRLHAACRSMGDRSRRYADQDALDQLSQVVFFGDLYRDGLGLCFCIRTVGKHIAPGGFSVAACGRYHLYSGRNCLCAKAPCF